MFRLVQREREEWIHQPRRPLS